MKRMVFNASDLESLVIIVENFDFDNKVLENVSQDSTYIKLVNNIKNSIRSGLINPILIMDKGFGVLFNGFINGANVELTSASGDTTYNVSLVYDIVKDELKITLVEETLTSQDNIKTIFGQSISGTGNITMYRHDLTFADGGGERYVGVVYSSKDLEVNTFDKLATLIGRTGNQNILVSKLTNIDEATKDANNIIVYWFEIGAVWRARNNTSTVNIALSSVSDVVRPI